MQALFEAGRESIKAHREHLLEVGAEEPAGNDNGASGGAAAGPAAVEGSDQGPTGQDGRHRAVEGVSREGLVVYQHWTVADAVEQGL